MNWVKRIFLDLTCAQWNPLITNVDGLRSLNTVPNGDLAIQVEELFAARGLHFALTETLFQYNLALVDVKGLSNIITTDGLFIQENPLLTNLDGLENLTTINGELMISVCAPHPSSQELITNVWPSRRRTLCCPASRLCAISSLSTVMYKSAYSFPALPCCCAEADDGDLGSAG
jgi:hypothetical protein